MIAGGETLIVTLTDDTWDATIGADNSKTTDLINGIDSAQSEAAGWDAVVKANLDYNDVVRTSDTVVTITLGAEATYLISATETITVTVPATAVAGTDALVATPTFAVTPPSPSSPVTTYSFQGVTTANHGDGTNPIAIEHDSDVFPWTTAADQNDSANPTDAEYVNISADNTSQWATDDPGSIDEMAVTYRFYLQETVSDITNIEITWNGNTDTGTANHSIWLRKDGFDEFGGTSTWVQLGAALSIPQDVDTDLIRNLTSDFSTYVNASTGQFEFVVTTDRSDDDLRTNFIQVAVTGPAVTLTGTLSDGATEEQIVGGGQTLIMTLAGDTWDATIGADNAKTTALIAGIDSAQAEAAGWDAVVKANLDYNDVVRSSDTVVTITLGTETTYYITATETITVTVRATALAGTDAMLATPTFNVTPPVSGSSEVAFKAVSAMNTENDNSGTSSVVNFPTNVEGDFLVAFINASNSTGSNPSATHADLAGWTELFDISTGASTANGLFVAYRFAPAGGITSATFTASATTGYISWGLVFTGVDTGTPIDASAAGTAQGASGSVTAPAVTTLTDGALVIRVMSKDDNSQTFTVIPGDTRFSGGADGPGDGTASAWGDAIQASAGDSGTENFTWTGDSEENIAATFALRPAATGPTAALNGQAVGARARGEGAERRPRDTARGPGRGLDVRHAVARRRAACLPRSRQIGWGVLSREASGTPAETRRAAAGCRASVRLQFSPVLQRQRARLQPGGDGCRDRVGPVPRARVRARPDRGRVRPAADLDGASPRTPRGRLWGPIAPRRARGARIVARLDSDGAAQLPFVGLCPTPRLVARRGPPPCAAPRTARIVARPGWRFPRPASGPSSLNQ